MKQIHVFLLLLLMAVSIVTLRACGKPEEVPDTEEEEIQVEEIVEPTPLVYTPDPTEVDAAARLIYAEAGEISSTMEKAAVVWCAANRVDSGSFPNTLVEVIEQSGQFAAYSKDLPVTNENKKIAEDVLTRYYYEKQGEDSVGRVLPKTYLYYRGNGVHNYFTEEFLGWEVWMFDCENPYE